MNDQQLQNSEWFGGGLHRVGYNKEDVIFGGYYHRFRDFYAAEKMKLSKEERKKVAIRYNRYVPPVLVSDILTKVGEYMVNHRSGVYMKGMGYFFVYRNPVLWHRAVMRRGRPLRFMPVFVPTINDENFWGWSMDFTFRPWVKKGIRERLNEGQRYLNMYPALNRDKSTFNMGWKYVDPESTRIKGNEKIVTKDANGNYIIDFENFYKISEYKIKNPYARK